MDIEYRKLCEALGGKSEGVLAGNEVVLWQCGIGKVNAAVGTLRLIQEHHPDVILSTGLAGGIDKCLSVMDVVVGSQAVYHDVWCGEGDYGQVQGMPPRFSADERLLSVARTVAGESPAFHFGLICSGDKFITDRTELAAIKEAFPEGLAVDMESGAIAHTCHLHGVPFLSFRIISDTPGVDSHWDQYENFWQTIAEHSFSNIHRFIESL